MDTTVATPAPEAEIEEETNDSVWIQYVCTFKHVDSLPVEVAKSLNRPNGSLDPIVAYSWSWSGDYSKSIAPGYRPPVTRSEGREDYARRGDWVVRSSAMFPAASEDSPHRAIVVCTVEYDPIPESEQRWSRCRQFIDGKEIKPDSAD